MTITNKILSLIGFPEPVDLLRFDGENLLPESMLVVAIASKTSDIIDKSIKSLAINVIRDHSLVNEKSISALVFDASHYQSEQSFNDVYLHLSGLLTKLKINSRIVIIATSINNSQTHQEKAFSRSLLGFTKSLAKEVGRKGTTVNILYIDNDINTELDGPLSFLLSSKSTFISGQSLHIATKIKDCKVKKSKKVALVTGAAQGIGAAIAKTLARDGVKVIGLDIEPVQEMLIAAMKNIDGEAISLDISSDEAGEKLVHYLREHQLDGFDLIIHNAGITRDKTFAKMPEHWWSNTLEINLLAVMRINEYLLEHNAINDNGRIVCMSSMNGIAGQVGQTNYATSKAGLIGYVDSLAEEVSNKNITINAIAPGFIETKMTNQIPFITREMGRRMNALSQGGKTQDVAEAVAFFTQDSSYAITGQTLRVCGLNFIGA
ncbi:MAG: 3-oxoacyl-ACP reductase [Colwellia sp.]|nr:3-oxoacyl-ACP reductase [Colwellia sp.]